MPIMKWDAKIAVGHGTIDAQHQTLFDRVNALYDAMMAGKGRDELGRTLAFLREYTVEHFQMEQDLMQKSGYPGFLAHKAIHDDLTAKVVDLEAKLAGGSKVLSMEVMNFLRDWLQQHISLEDKRLAAHLHQSGN
jgi:hemerythrin-like metal-binding protein